MYQWESPDHQVQFTGSYVLTLRTRTYALTGMCTRVSVKCTCLAHWKYFLFRPRFFSRFLGCGARMYTTAQASDPAGLCDACSGSSKSHELAFFVKGVHSATSSQPAQDHGDTTISAFRSSAVAVTPSFQTSSSLFCGSHGYSSSRTSSSTSVAATGSPSWCVRECVRNVSCRSKKWERTNHDLTSEPTYYTEPPSRCGHVATD